MEQFTEGLIAQVRERTDLLELVSRHVTLKRAGVNWLGLCPFHREKTPSFSLRPDRGFFKCFGCGASGDAFAFVMQVKGIGFAEAVRELALASGVPLPASAPQTREQQQAWEERQRLLVWMTRVKEFYREGLQAPVGEVARRYLQDRGLRPETVERFGLGFAPPGWRNLLERFVVGLRLPPGAVGTLEALTSLDQAGLIIRRSETGYAGADPSQAWYDRFRHRIIFPIHDRTGQCLGFGGRVLQADEQPKYLNSPETILYHKGRVLYGLGEALPGIRREDAVLVVEGYLDLIALANHGIDQVVATLGTALTGDHLKQLRPLARKLIFCFDGDEAGRRAAWRALEMVLGELESDRFVSFLLLPGGQDPDQVVSREGREGFLRRVDQAVSVLDFMLLHLGADLDTASPEGKAALLRRCGQHLKRIPDPVLRGAYLDSLHQRLPIGRGVAPMRERPERRGMDGGKAGFGLAHPGAPERRLVAMLLRFPDWIEAYEEDLGAVALWDQQLAALLAELIRIAHRSPGIDAGGMSSAVIAEGWGEVVAGIVQDEGSCFSTSSEAEALGEWEGCLAVCRQRELSRELAQVVRGVALDGSSGVAWERLLALRKERDRARQERGVNLAGNC